jgi:hypothetical protein
MLAAVLVLTALVLLVLATVNVAWPRFHPGWCAVLLLVVAANLDGFSRLVS